MKRTTILLLLLAGFTISLHAQLVKVESFKREQTRVRVTNETHYYLDEYNKKTVPAYLDIFYVGKEDVENVGEIDSVSSINIVHIDKRSAGSMRVQMRGGARSIRVFCKKRLPLTITFYDEMSINDKNDNSGKGLQSQMLYTLYLKDVQDDYIHVEDTARYISIENNELIIPSTDSRLTQIPRLAGNMAVDRFLQNHIIYPTDGSLDKIEGEFLINFVVNKEGQIASFALVSERIKMPDTRMQRRMAKSKRDDFRNLFRKKFTEELNAAFSQMQWEKIGMRLNENNVEEPANVEFRKVHLTFEP